MRFRHTTTAADLPRIEFQICLVQPQICYSWGVRRYTGTKTTRLRLPSVAGPVRRDLKYEITRGVRLFGDILIDRAHLR